MTDSSTSAEKLLARCFSVEELTWLLEMPEFVQAAHQMKTVEDALRVIEMGQHLIRTDKTFKSPESISQFLPDSTHGQTLQPPSLA